MNLQQLEYLSILAKVQNYTQAAKILHVTQPTISYSITNLEKELGTELFEKHGRNIVLTKQGELFNKGASQALQILNNTTEELKREQNKDNVVKVASLRTLFYSWLPNTIKNFTTSFSPSEIQPKFKFTSSNGYSKAILNNLLEINCDIAFCSKVNNHPDIDYFPVVEQNLVLITPLDHPLADLESVDLVDTLKYKQITFSPTSGLSSELKQLFSLCGGMPESIYEVEEDEAVAGMVSAGFGIGVVPDMYNLKSLPLSIIPIRFPVWHRLIYMATLKGHYQTPASRAFINFVKETTHLKNNITQI
ncbi:LysR family transcriptional regulator [Tetragenococcus solitarius]|uniref:LysR family transcriptional regulator n=1 Tax=Tetragenococcus solitarius TaxID=71453 RepID=A0ABP6KPB3_9ENTE|nr:LysR family transcriptional regulator [Tetragenococcus solitarius]